MAARTRLQFASLDDAAAARPVGVFYVGKTHLQTREYQKSTSSASGVPFSVEHARQCSALLDVRAEMAKGLAEHVHGGRVTPDRYTKFWIEGHEQRPVTDVMFSTRFVRKADKRAFKFDTGYPFTDEGGPSHFGFRVELDKRPAEAVAELSRLLSRPDVSARILAVPGTELLAERYQGLPFWKCHLTGSVDQRRSEMAARSLDLIYAVLPALGPVTLNGQDFILR